MRLDDAVKCLGRDVVDLLDAVHIHIDHGTTLVTIEVIVKACVCIEVIKSVSDPDLLQFSELGEQLQITVYGSERDVGIFVTDMHIYGICRRVIFTTHHEFFYCFSLSGIFKCHDMTAVLSG